MTLRFPTDDTELKTIVRGETSYEDTEDELPDLQLDTIVARSKGRLQLKTGSTNWYSDNGLGFALAAYTAMRAKAAVENIPLSGYSLGDTDVQFVDTDPDDSQQLQQWAEDIDEGLENANVDSGAEPIPANTAGYVGETYYRD